MPESTLLQVLRVAKARNLTEEVVKKTVVLATEGRQLGFLGDPKVNLLVLNMELDRL